MVAMLRSRKQVKPAGGRWLNSSALAAHLRGEPVGASEHTGDLYPSETRLGIALDAKSRTASDGAIYTTEVVAFCAQVGFIVGVQGATAACCRRTACCAWAATARARAIATCRSTRLGLRCRRRAGAFG